MHGLCDQCGEPYTLACGWCRMEFCTTHSVDHIASDYHKRKAAPIGLSLLAEIEQVLEQAGVEPVDPDAPGEPKSWCMLHDREGMVTVWHADGYEKRPCECRFVKG